MQADPEGFIRSLDADTGPDADNPRACGVALLLCMLRKGAGHVAEAMLAYVSHLQVCCCIPHSVNSAQCVSICRSRNGHGWLWLADVCGTCSWEFSSSLPLQKHCLSAPPPYLPLQTFGLSLQAPCSNPPAAPSLPLVQICPLHSSNWHPAFKAPGLHSILR